MNGVPPTANAAIICHGFGCKFKQTVPFDRAADQKLKRILAGGGKSAKAERAAISRAVVWQERRIGKIVGSTNDVGGLDMHNSGKRGQMDCIDESANTTSLLLYAQSRGFLEHHNVERPTARGFFLDGRYPHASAVISEKKTGKAYVVDSWRLPNAKPPDIILVEQWMKITAADLE
ncbi:hypothetical protein E1162_01330 [Rhodobacteraceae bacterium RKSG542]|nr:hypothetical protein [Pseudovibrio flavus]